MAEITHIKGAKELERVLNELPDYIAKRVARGALSAAAEVIREEAAQNAPIGDKIHTDKKGNRLIPGTLKASVRKWHIKNDQTAHTAAMGIGLPKGSIAWYGRLLEFGWSGDQAGHPWLRPAVDTKHRQALDVLGKKLGDGIERAAKKLAGKYTKSGVRRK